MASGGQTIHEANRTAFYIENVNNLKVGNEIHYHLPTPSDRQLRLEELGKKLHLHLKNIHREENRIIQCLPTDDDEELLIEDHFSPLKITETGSEQDLNLCDVIRNDKKVYIAGDVGSGKSTLCKKMCYDWSVETENNYLREFKYVFNVPLRLVGDESIKKYIFNEIIDFEFDTESIQSILDKNGDKILFFLDGLDEMANCDKSLRAIFKSFPDATFVVSSRFAWNQKKVKDEKFKRRLVLHGFTDEGVDIFRLKFFADLEDNRFYIDKLIKSDDSCAKNCVKNFKCPLFLTLLFYCLKFSNPLQREPLKVTQLYIEMFDILRSKSKKSISSIDLNIKLIEFGEKALKAIKDDNILFDKIDINDDFIIKLGFLRQDIFIAPNNKKIEKYQPVHKTFLEFLAALYMKNLLLNDISKFNIEIDSMPDKSIHSKQAKSGAKFSLFIVFLCGLLGENAHLFFQVLDTKYGDRFKNVLNIILLLWHSDVTKLNIAHVTRSHRLNQNCLTDFAERSNDVNVNKSNWNILSILIEDRNCRLGKLDLNESILIKIDDDNRDLIVKSLSINRSITRLELIRIGTTPLSADVSEVVVARKMPMFIDIVKSIPRIEEIIVNQDIFIDKLSIHEDFIRRLIVSLNGLKLKKLSIIASPIVFDICDIFIDNVSTTNGVIDSKSKRKHKNPRLSKEHGDLIIDNVNTSIIELHLSRLDIDFIDFFPFIDLRVLKLPFLKCQNELDFVYNLLSNENCKLRHLDLTGYEFKRKESIKLIDILKSNKSLTYLNLAHSSLDQAELIDLFQVLKFNTALTHLNVAHTSFTQYTLRYLLDSVVQNGVIEHLNLSSKEMVVNDEKAKLFFGVLKMSKIKELHLSGWIFEFKNIDIFAEIVSEMKGFNNLEAFCLKNAHFVLSIDCNYDFDAINDLIIIFFNNLLFNTNFKRLNIKNFDCDVRPQVAQSDSGFFETETETSNPFLRQIESCSKKVENKIKVGKIKDFYTKLKIDKLIEH